MGPRHQPGTVWHPASLVGDGLRRCAGAAALWFAAMPAPAHADAFDDLALCITIQHSLDELTATFVADGWTLVTEGPDHERASNATAEITWAFVTSPNRFRTAEAAEAYLARAHRAHAMRTEPYNLLVRGDRSLLLEWSTNGHRGQNICLLVAPRLDHVGDAMPAAMDDPDYPRAYATAQLPLYRAPAFIRKVTTTAARLRVPAGAQGMLAGGDGVHMTVIYKWE